MSGISIRKISITDIQADAIVNAANSGLQAGGGVCGAIFKKAGYQKLQAACDAIGHCDTGKAVITPAFGMTNAKYIIHAVGPIWQGGDHHEPQLLYGAYQSSLKLAVDHGCSSIAFPLISAGIYGYPLEGAWRKAIQACRDYLQKNPEAEIDIVFAVLDEKVMYTGRQVLHDQAPDLATACADDWKTTPMPDKHDTFTLKRTFTDQQMQILRRGHIPQEMEDKWFWYMEGDTLYAHRSWTGICIYSVKFTGKTSAVVTVNREPEQYGETSIEEDYKRLNDLLNWWTGSTYDYYSEWLSETVNTLKKSGQIGDTLKVNDRMVSAVYFHLPEEPDGYLSNWYRAEFDLDGIHFTSTEQYIMYRKCTLLGDQASAKAVLATDDPEKQQAIGQKAQGYIGNLWAGSRQMIAAKGLMAKFSQNEDLKQQLLSTGDSWLVECAGSDKVWACGVRLNDDRRRDIANWTGTNILGFALMQVREMLKNEET